MFLCSLSVAEDAAESRQLSKAYDGLIYYTVGVHPHHIRGTEQFARWRDEMRELLQQSHAVAVGPAGLDLNNSFAPAKNIQIKWLELQFELSQQCLLPLIVVDYSSTATLLRLLGEHRARGFNQAVLVHSFAGSEEQFDEYLAADCYIGISGVVCSEEYRETFAAYAKKLQLNRFVLQSDSPHHTPETIADEFVRTQPNEPSNLNEVLAYVSSVSGIDAQQLQSASTRNALRLFDLAVGRKQLQIANVTPENFETQLESVFAVLSASSDELTIEFPAWLSKEQRKQIHERAGELGLQHDSVGAGIRRRIQVTKGGANVE